RSGWNWTPQRGRLVWRIAWTAHSSDAASCTKPSGSALSSQKCRCSTSTVRLRPAKRGSSPRIRTAEGPPFLPHPGRQLGTRADFAGAERPHRLRPLAKDEPQELVAAAEPEEGHFGGPDHLEERLETRRVVVVDQRAVPAQDHHAGPDVGETAPADLGEVL